MNPLRHWRPEPDLDRMTFMLTAAKRTADDAAGYRAQEIGFGFLERHLDARSDHRIILGSDRRNAARLKRVEAERVGIGR